MLIYGRDDELIPWAAEKIGIRRFRSDATAIGVARDQQIVAVMVYDGFSSADCNMHIASDGSRRFVTRAALAHWFCYPFVQLGLRRVTGLIPSRNDRSINFARGLGFSLEGVCREAMPDDDLVIMGLLKRECRYIPKEYRHA